MSEHIQPSSNISPRSQAWRKYIKRAKSPAIPTSTEVRENAIEEFDKKYKRSNAWKTYLKRR